ncbi:winged helix-turn-helix domain-containing tetratricopeptide repeat protein [Aestuariirhabdus litorea]|uniref:OmpR/PhoB-type domain-containing protein n=1 Tax=Aestuariirhabdus litorea TaxID=2528527 RepID=A0A3P3VLY3_9GAMM|nr:winged helix-turn-helix domain-containing protein [Aestuariirhabdus litorea]RRJ83745.1 hypothetical protein D0544_01075 [Aestuariirhabdus litorea]RWW96968.1 hypothetical protein DZC74_01075 [Endozoicomonadaceae bacterium GTF-13]
MLYRFSNIQIDSERFELLRDGVPVAVEPRVFDLLLHLVAHPMVLFSHDELVAAVWEGRCVSDATVASALKNARKALGDDGRTQRYIKTVHGRGVRFQLAPDEVASTDGSPPSKTSAEVSGTATPSLLVMPFAHDTQVLPMTHCAQGLQADLQALLTRIPLLRIHTLGRSEVPEASARQWCQRQGVDFLLEGSARQTHEGVRVNLSLTDVASGCLLWAEPFEVRLSERGVPERELSNSVLAKLEPQLVKAMLSATSSAGELSPTGLYIRASGELATRGWHRDTFEEAAGLLRRCLQQQPGFTLARSYLALVLALGGRFGLLEDSEALRQEALAAAERSMDEENSDSTVLGFAGCALADLGHVDRAKRILHNALDISAANAQAWAALGSVFLMQRNPSEAVRCLRKSIELSPLDSRLSLWGSVLALALFLNNEPQAAMEQAEWACRRDDRIYFPHVVLAAVASFSDELPRMQRALKEARRIKPDLSAHEVSCLLGRQLGQALLAAEAAYSRSSPELH